MSAVLLLAIDTSTSAITVALHDGSTVLAEATTVDARGHAEHLAPGIRGVLDAIDAAPTDVTHVAVGLGPGPFTGLRVGIVTARTFALAVGATVHGLCSLDVLAHQAVASGAVIGGELAVATDARRKEVYWARYAAEPAQPGGIRRIGDPQVTRPADLGAEALALPTIGRGPQLYPVAWAGDARCPGESRLTPGRPEITDVSAAALAELVVRRLAAGAPVDEQEPFYLRRPDAVPSVTSKSALG